MMRTSKRDADNDPVICCAVIEEIQHEQMLTPDRVGSALLRARSYRDARVREVVLEYLPRMAVSDAEWHDFLFATFSDRDGMVRRAAAEAAARLQLSEAIPELTRLLKDRHELVRVEAVEALWHLGASSSAPDVLDVMENDPSALVRGYAARALVDLIEEKAIVPLEQRLGRERSRWTRALLLLSLYRLGKVEVLSDLLRLLKSRDYHVRCVIANSIDLVANASNARSIATALSQSLERETTVAGREALERALALVEKEYSQDRASFTEGAPGSDLEVS